MIWLLCFCCTICDNGAPLNLADVFYLQTPEKAAPLPTSTNAASLTTSPEQVPQAAHESYSSVPSTAHLASGVNVHFETGSTDYIQNLETPLVSPAILTEPQEEIKTTTKPLEQPEGERLTVTGGQDKSSPRVIAALSADPSLASTIAAANAPASTIASPEAKNASGEAASRYLDSGAASQSRIPAPPETATLAVPAQSQPRETTASRIPSLSKELPAQTQTAQDSHLEAVPGQTAPHATEASITGARGLTDTSAASPAAAPATSKDVATQQPKTRFPAAAVAQTLPLAAVAPAVAVVAHEKEAKLHPGENFETTAVAPGPHTADSAAESTAHTSGATPLAAVAPAVAEVAHEKEAKLHPGENFETTAVAPGPQAALSASQSTARSANPTPLAAVAPAVAEVAHEKEAKLHPGENFETTAVAPGPENVGTASPSLARVPYEDHPVPLPEPLIRTADRSLLDASEKQAVAAGLREEAAARSTVTDPSLQDAVRQQKVAEALRAESEAPSRGHERANSTESAKTVSTEDISTLVEPGTPVGSVNLDPRGSSSLALTDTSKEVDPSSPQSTLPLTCTLLCYGLQQNSSRACRLAMSAYLLAVFTVQP